MKAENFMSMEDEPYGAEVNENIGIALPTFNKKAILKHLSQCGCSEASFEQVLLRFVYPKEVVMDYLNHLLRESEKYLHQESASFCFNSIQSWLLIFEQANWVCPVESLAAYIAEISDLEELPSPTELNGIDLKAAYKFISNGLLGLPQPSLDLQTLKFLATETEALIDEVNTEKGDELAYLMYEALERNEKLNRVFRFNKHDPLGLG